jgi:hypothetical protein
LNEILRVIRISPLRLKEGLTDPIRRRHIVGQIAVCYLSALPFAGWFGAAGVTFLNFLLYEYVGETLFKRWFGPYWERGPRDGERLVNE